MLFGLWEKDRDKLLILSLGHPSPFRSASYWAVFVLKDHSSLTYSAPCFHEVSATDLHKGEKVRMFFMDSVKFMLKTYPCQVVLGLAEAVSSALKCECLSLPP